MVVLIVAILSFSLPLLGANYYVSPSGNNNNPGTFAEPWALTAVCRATRSATPMSALSAGDTVWFRGGRYPTTQTMYCEHTATAGARITHRAYPGERPIIAAQPPGWSGPIIVISGSHVTFDGIDVTYDGPLVQNSNAHPDNQVPHAWSTVSQLMGNPTGVVISNSYYWRTRGIVATATDHSTTYSGLVGFANSLGDIDRNHGGNCYAQNTVANGWETYENNVWLLASGHYNCRGYATSGNVQGIRLTGNITLGGNNYWYRDSAGDQGPYDVAGNVWVLDSNYLYFNKLTELTFTNNVVATMTALTADLRIANYDAVTATGNRLHGYPAGLNVYTRNVGGTYTVDDNDYSTQAPPSTNASARACVSTPDYGGRPHNTGGYPTYWPLLDPHPEPASTCTDGLPTTNIVRVIPNDRESGRAHVAVLNYEGLTAAAVDLSSVLRSGDRYEVVDLWNPLGGAVVTGTYTGTTVSIPLTGTATYNPEQPLTCWQVDRASCFSSGEYPTAGTVGELPVGAFVGQRAILSTYAMHRWTGSAWSASLGTVNTVPWPSFARIADAHAFLVRRRYDGRADAIVAYTDPGEHVLSAGYRLPDDSYVWTELPAHSRTCANGRCTARIPVAVGDAWWRIDTGPAWKLAAR